MTTQLAESSSETAYRSQKAAVSARPGSIGAASTCPPRGQARSAAATGSATNSSCHGRQASDPGPCTRQTLPAQAAYAGAVDDTDAVVERILTTYDTITVVGASGSPWKPSHTVPLHMQRMGWRIVPVNPHSDALFGERCFPTLADVAEPVGFVNVFRPSQQ